MGAQAGEWESARVLRTHEWVLAYVREQASEYASRRASMCSVRRRAGKLSMQVSEGPRQRQNGPSYRRCPLMSVTSHKTDPHQRTRLDRVGLGAHGWTGYEWMRRRRRKRLCLITSVSMMWLGERRRTVREGARVKTGRSEAT